MGAAFWGNSRPRLSDTRSRGLPAMISCDQLDLSPEEWICVGCLGSITTVAGINATSTDPRDNYAPPRFHYAHSMLCSWTVVSPLTAKLSILLPLDRLLHYVRRRLSNREECASVLSEPAGITPPKSVWRESPFILQGFFASPPLYSVIVSEFPEPFAQLRRYDA
jgi:hypothetical protein